MKKSFIIILMGVMSFLPSLAQEEVKGFFKKHPFVNMTEFGLLFGRGKFESYNYLYRGYYPQPYEPVYQVKNRLNLSMQTFNGIYLNPKTSVGITVGVDSYGSTVLMPFSAGIRRSLVQKKHGGSMLLSSLDVGYATTWLNEENSGFQTKGGFSINPAIGYKLPMRNGSAWLINVGYRIQRAEYSQKRTDDFYWYESNEVRNYKRFVVRFGIEF